MSYPRRFHRWMRVVLPHNAVTLLAAGVWALVNLAMGLSNLWLESLDLEPKSEGIVSLNAVFAAGYGLYRAGSFHPIFSSDCRDWLTLQPWTPEQPLPAGPILLAWQDLVLLALFIAPVLLIGESVVPVLVAFLVPCVLVWSYANWRTQQDAAAYLAAFVLPIALLYVQFPLLALAPVVLAYAIAAWGTERGLDLFPWKAESLKPGLRRRLAENSQSSRQSSEALVGWPQRTLLDESAFIGIGHGHAALLSLLAGWWALIAVTLLRAGSKPVDFESTAPLLPLLVAPNLALFRWIAYCSGTRAPIDLIGRISTGRLIIPGYHYVLLPPLAIAVVGTPAHLVLAYGLGIPLQWAIAIAVGVCLWATLALPPTMRDWRLTGHLRAVPGILRDKRQFETL